MITIIIPVYNTEKYLPECLGSIFAQTYSDFELLLVDDGSTDRSGEICDEYAQKDSRIRVFHKENGGVSSARNIGIDNAKGDWVCFVDSDDTIAEDFLSYYSRYINENIDLFFSKYTKVNENGEELGECCVFDGSSEFSLKDFLKVIYTSGGYSYQGYIWNKFFRMSVIRQHALRFDENIYFNEDRLFITQYVCASKKNVKFINSLTYYYLIHQNSAMASLKEGYNRRFVTDFDAFVLMKKEVEKLPFGHELRCYTVNGICNSYNQNHQMMLHNGDYDSRNHWHMLWGLMKSGAFFYQLKNVIKPIIMMFFPNIYIRRNKKK